MQDTQCPSSSCFSSARLTALCCPVTLIYACSSTQPYVDEPLSQVCDDERQQLKAMVAGVLPS